MSRAPWPARRSFLAAALIGGVALVAVTPPFQAPDEPAHFYRAYSISEGRLLVATVDGAPGEWLPSSLRDLVEVLAADVPFHPQEKIPPGTFRRARELRLEPGERQPIAFPTTAQYSPLPYLPQAAGIAVGRWLGVSPLALVYFARLANLCAAIALIYFSLGQLPAYRWLATLLALMPMAMFLRSSVSADACTTAIAFLLTATVVKLAFAAEPGRWRDCALLIGSSAALCLTKPVYLPLVLAAFVIPADRLPGRRRLLVLSSVVAVSICAFASAVAIARPSVAVIADEPGNVLETLRQPGRMLTVVAGDYFRHSPRYAEEFIGRLGWLDTPLPVWLLVSYLIGLIAVMALDTAPTIVIEPWQRAVLALAVAGTALAIGGAIYTLGSGRWTGHIEGIQGRYFHPLALAAAWVFYFGRGWHSEVAVSRDGRRIGLGVALLTALSLVITLAVIIRRYYG